MQVQELMTEPPVMCRATDTLDTAAQLMWERDCGAIPVIDDDGSLVGMITDRDVCMAAYTRGRSLGSIRVDDAMAKRVFTVNRHDSLEAVEQLMSDAQIRRVPVVDGARRPIGIVTLNDIARRAASTRTNGRMSADVTRTLAAISRPREPAAISEALAEAHRPAM